MSDREIPEPITSQYMHETLLNLIDNMNLDKNIKILDAGCGEGALLLALKKRGFKNIYGCDINREQFKLDTFAGFKKCDLNKGLPYENSSFDLILSVENIEHLENPWLLIEEFYRVLKCEGILILTTPNLQNWYNRVYFLFKSGFIGFDNEEKYHITPIFFWNLKKMIRFKFSIDKINFNRSIIPFLRINFPVRNFFFGDSMIVIMKKI